ncbi:MAG: rane protein [Acidimicrobiaceae bacterium]|jgi:membrane protein|nr:rane protein [Acidimicrobiaceae bacterium]
MLAPLTRRFAWARTGLAVQKRFGEVNGGYLASAVTLAAFLSIFPLLLVAIAVVGFISSGHDVAGAVIRNLGLTGEAATTMTESVQRAAKTRQAASIVGLGGLLWSGLGLVAALQYALDSVWQVRGRGIKDKLFGLAWLAGCTVLFAMSLALTTVMNFLPGFLNPLAVVVSLAFDVGLWLFTLTVLPHREVGWKPLLPGAILGAVGLEVLKAVGTIYVPRMVSSSSGLYGTLGIAFAILAWLFFFGRLLVYSAVLNVVRWEEDHGTVTAEIEMPNLPGQVTVAATRAGEAQPVT